MYRGVPDVLGGSGIGRSDSMDPRRLKRVSQGSLNREYFLGSGS